MTEKKIVMLCLLGFAMFTLMFFAGCSPVPGRTELPNNLVRYENEEVVCYRVNGREGISCISKSQLENKK